MSQITIRCRLTASEADRERLWNLMAHKNTPLVNELLRLIPLQPDFPKWLAQGSLPAKVITTLCKPLRQDPRFSWQPARCFVSAEKMVHYTFQTWLATHRRLQSRISGKLHWLNVVLVDDSTLVSTAGCSLEVLRTHAASLLQEFDSGITHLRKALLNALDTATCEPRRSAIAYLLKHKCVIPNEPENPDKFARNRRKAEIQLERLQAQLKVRQPQGRDLDGHVSLNALETLATHHSSDPNENARWQANFWKKQHDLPFPLLFETNVDLFWSKNAKGRLIVHLSGLQDLDLAVHYDQRQRHWFERFYEDQQVKKKSGRHSAGLFTLRVARLRWLQGTAKGKPWNVHRLELLCYVDTRLWTKEGTAQVRDEKCKDFAAKLSAMKAKKSQVTLSKGQENYIKRLSSTEARLAEEFPRPSRPLYRGREEIVVAVLMSLAQPATAVVWNKATGTLLRVQNVRQLLGEQYSLLNRYRQQQQVNARRRRRAHTRCATVKSGESELGLYIDRLLASAIAKLAQQEGASSIIVPKLSVMREAIQAEIQALAEERCPGSVKTQKRYAKSVVSSLHRWSYGRLIKAIATAASKRGISIEEGEQLIRGALSDRITCMVASADTARIEQLK